MLNWLVYISYRWHVTLCSKHYLLQGKVGLCRVCLCVWCIHVCERASTQRSEGHVESGSHREPGTKLMASKPKGSSDLRTPTPTLPRGWEYSVCVATSSFTGHGLRSDPHACATDKSPPEQHPLWLPLPCFWELEEETFTSQRKHFKVKLNFSPSLPMLLSLNMFKLFLLVVKIHIT